MDCFWILLFEHQSRGRSNGVKRVNDPTWKLKVKVKVEVKPKQMNLKR
jgi:hypothetical protein